MPRNPRTINTFCGWSRLKLDYIYQKGLVPSTPHRANSLDYKAPNEREGSDHTSLTASFEMPSSIDDASPARGAVRMILD